MSKKKTISSGRAWNVLRLALLWARKGGAFQRGLKSLCQTNTRNPIYYNEKEFSFDETPLFDFKMPRPNSMRFHIPCLKPQQVDFDCNDEREGDWLKEYNERLQDDQLVEVEDEGIDVKAEEFIAKFYEQMKLQRQISYLQYNEMLDRGTK